jgi:D-cysteine desulfhydrase family pyridoxal phosphate-dependent enzyme
MSHRSDLINFPRFPLALLPTPIHELARLGPLLGGPRIIIKRDDQTGLATGGNKTRKLEFLLADALQNRANVLITAGALQSNHCRQTAAAANLAGLRCELVLNGEKPNAPNGNLLLDMFLGARIYYTTRSNRNNRMQEVSQALINEGQKPYIIPVGGSTGLGALGYALAMVELMEQLKAAKFQVDHILFASSSGGTQAGLVLGAKIADFQGRLLGISIDNDKLDGRPFQIELAQIANEAGRLLHHSYNFTVDDFSVQYDYLGKGYGVVGDLEVEAIGLAARQEGLLLDPVYTSRAFGAMVDMIRQGVFSQEETILFWHTGGSAALFAYAAELDNKVNIELGTNLPCR